MKCFFLLSLLIIMEATAATLEQEEQRCNVEINATLKSFFHHFVDGFLQSHPHSPDVT